MHFKNNIKIGEFLCSHFNIEDGRKYATFWNIESDQTETLIENNECYSMWEIADVLKISKSIKLLVKMKNGSFILQEKKPIWTFWPPQCFS